MTKFNGLILLLLLFLLRHPASSHRFPHQSVSGQESNVMAKTQGSGVGREGRASVYAVSLAGGSVGGAARGGGSTGGGVGSSGGGGGGGRGSGSGTRGGSARGLGVGEGEVSTGGTEESSNNSGGQTSARGGTAGVVGAGTTGNTHIAKGAAAINCRAPATSALLVLGSVLLHHLM